VRAQTLRALASDPSGVRIVEGVVTGGPVDRTSPVAVAYASRPDHTVAETPHWNRDGDHLPQPDDRCVLIESPGVDPIVIWSPSE
jgi:hypothetical protein